MFVRFVVWQTDRDSGKAQGAYHAAFRLHDQGMLFSHEVQHLQELREWFNEHLKTPTRFTSSKPPYYRRKSNAISWFKDSAHEHIAKMREVVTILEGHGVSVRMLKAERVGYVVYEDQHQVVAEPFSNVDC